MRRREFITLVGGAAAAVCSVARAQTRRERPLIATFRSGTPTQRKGLPFVASFLNGLRELGYIEGRDFDIVALAAASNDELPKVAEELSQLKPDVILVSASINALATKRTTSTIPIVVAALGNPASLGLSESDFRRPSGNLTGIMPYVRGLPAKQLEIAREIVPGAQKIGIVHDTSDVKADNGTKSMLPPQILRSRS
jgi:putative tryptophan/tyrosine transport system substrate-binding protein